MSRPPLCPIGSLVTCTSTDCAALQRLLDPRWAAFERAGVVVDLAGVEHGVAAAADVDERGLHARQDVLHLAEVDVADHRRRVLAGDVVLDQHAVLEHRDLGPLVALAHDHDAVDRLAAGQELRLGDDRRPTAADVSRPSRRRWRFASIRVEPLTPRTPSSTTALRGSRTWTTVFGGSSGPSPSGPSPSPDVVRRRRRRRRVAAAPPDPRRRPCPRAVVAGRAARTAGLSAVGAADAGRRPSSPSAASPALSLRRPRRPRRRGHRGHDGHGGDGSIGSRRRPRHRRRRRRRGVSSVGGSSGRRLRRHLVGRGGRRATRRRGGAGSAGGGWKSTTGTATSAPGRRPAARRAPSASSANGTAVAARRRRRAASAQRRRRSASRCGGWRSARRSVRQSAAVAGGGLLPDPLGRRGGARQRPGVRSCRIAAGRLAGGVLAAALGAVRRGRWGRRAGRTAGRAAPAACRLRRVGRAAVGARRAGAGGGGGAVGALFVEHVISSSAPGCARCRRPAQERGGRRTSPGGSAWRKPVGGPVTLAGRERG